MKLWLISQTVNSGYDTYSEAVVAAKTEGAARKINPGGREWDDKANSWMLKYADGSRSPDDDNTWTRPENVHVKEIGKAVPGTEPGVICASFHAG